MMSFSAGPPSLCTVDSGRKDAESFVIYSGFALGDAARHEVPIQVVERIQLWGEPRVEVADQILPDRFSESFGVHAVENATELLVCPLAVESPCMERACNLAPCVESLCTPPVGRF